MTRFEKTVLFLLAAIVFLLVGLPALRDVKVGYDRGIERWTTQNQ